MPGHCQQDAMMECPSCSQISASVTHPVKAQRLQENKLVLR